MPDLSSSLDPGCYSQQPCHNCSTTQTCGNSAHQKEQLWKQDHQSGCFQEVSKAEFLVEGEVANGDEMEDIVTGADTKEVTVLRCHQLDCSNQATVTKC